MEWYLILKAFINKKNNKGAFLGGLHTSKPVSNSSRLSFRTGLLWTPVNCTITFPLPRLSKKYITQIDFTMKMMWKPGHKINYEFKLLALFE